MIDPAIRKVEVVREGEFSVQFNFLDDKPLPVAGKYVLMSEEIHQALNEFIELLEKADDEKDDFRKILEERIEKLSTENAGMKKLLRKLKETYVS